VPNYFYTCETNGETVEVFHGMSESLGTWGEVCELAELDPGDTAPDSPVRKSIRGVATYRTTRWHDPKKISDDRLAKNNFQKLVRQSDGSYKDELAGRKEYNAKKKAAK
jgi:hypothetical protein